MLYHLQSLLNSFRYAFRGLLLCLKTQRNLRLELAAALWVIAAALALELSGGELAALLLCCGLVLSLELMNTAMEFTVDLCCPKPHPLAKAAKDAAAGGVLMAAVTAAAVGIVLFGRPDRLGLCSGWLLLPRCGLFCWREPPLCRRCSFSSPAHGSGRNTRILKIKKENRFEQYFHP